MTVADESFPPFTTPNDFEVGAGCVRAEPIKQVTAVAGIEDPPAALFMVGHVDSMLKVPQQTISG
ncbi:hypothetical protein ACQHIV_33305 [Kribbella sp. GL6]|uniref:hypothetical protein n=1 Tax=Kribbella sp. GL6 TaxID=3419765 RepID=UPI003D05B441